MKLKLFVVLFAKSMVFRLVKLKKIKLNEKNETKNKVVNNKVENSLKYDFIAI